MASSRHLSIVRAVGQQFQKGRTEFFNFDIPPWVTPPTSADAKHQWTLLFKYSPVTIRTVILPIFYDLASRQGRILLAGPASRRLGLPSFGEKLKLEREKRKVTLEQISVSTKIGIRMLRALEEDQFNQLPGGIFNKGFVRAYSRVLGLDEEQTVAEYLQASGDAPLVSVDASSHDPALPGGLPPGLPHNDRVGDAPHRDQRRDQHKEAEAEGKIRSLEAGSKLSGQQLPWGIFAALLLIVALALSLWSRYERASSKPASQSTPRVDESSQPAPQSSGGPSGAVAGRVSSPASNARLPEASGKDRGTGSSSTDVPKPGSPAANSAVVAHSSESATIVSTPAGELSVVIQAKEESWITITSDGKTVSSELLPAGGERTVHGRQQITVKAGNAGGVEFQFNGKKIAAVGQDGEVKTITFGPQGIT
jgi:cytoskeleton protein RodZ